MPSIKWLHHPPPTSIGWIFVILLKGRTNSMAHLHFLYSSSIIHILCSTTWLSQLPFIPILTCTHIHTHILYSSWKDLLMLMEVLCTVAVCGIEITLKWGTVERLGAQDDNPETACGFWTVIGRLRKDIMKNRCDGQEWYSENEKIGNIAWLMFMIIIIMNLLGIILVSKYITPCKSLTTICFKHTTAPTSGHMMAFTV